MKLGYRRLWWFADLVVMFGAGYFVGCVVSTIEIVTVLQSAVHHM